MPGFVITKPGIFFGETAMKILGSIALFPLLLLPVAEPSAMDLQELTDGKASINFRYRYEGVDQDGAVEDAAASTLRTRFTWLSVPVEGFTLGFEADYVSVVGEERYNSTTNGKTQYPVVADPGGFDLNLAYVGYAGDNLKVDLGRQRILHGSQRFVGGVGWRQNEQTYDALRLRSKPGEWSLDYSYVWNVNRIFGPDDGVQPSDWRGDSHLLVASRPLGEAHNLELFGYVLDFENDNGPPNSTSTWGIGYTGNFGNTKLTAVIASQSDFADSPLDYSAPYYLLEAAFKVNPVTITAGYEVLGSDDGTAGFRTPLATLHKFQGWSDKFLGTPARGIVDAYVGLKGRFNGISWNVTWHDFSAEEGSAGFGTELNLVLGYAISKKVSIQLKAADYQADSFAMDTTKYWLTTVVSL